MKKLIIGALVLFFALPVGMTAQTRYGVKAGMDRTNVRFYHVGSKARIGFQAGLFAYIPLNDYDSFFFQPEILYMQAGEKNIRNKGGANQIEEKYYINYISVPLMLKTYLSDDYSTFFVEFGPQIAFKIGQRSTSNQSELTAFTDYGADGDKVNPIDISIGLGAGFSFQRNWELGFRYNYGFSDVYPKTIGENEAKSNNSSNLQFTLAYILD